MVSIENVSKDRLQGKKVLVRVDFNVPMKDGVVANDQRIRAALPTLRYLLENEATLILMSHLGRPGGEVKEKLRLKPVGDYLSKVLETDVKSLPALVGPEVETEIQKGESRVYLLENTRFHPGETANDPELARSLAALGDLYVNDAFGTAHRAHASTAGVAQHLPAFAGCLLKKEIQALSQLTASPEHPFAAVIGGAKVSSKLGVLEHLLPRVDVLVIGGAMAYTFMAAQDVNVLNSLVEPELYDTARRLLELAKAENTRVILPEDTVLAEDTGAETETSTVIFSALDEEEQESMKDLSGVDIGPLSINAIGKALEDSQTILWNGPMGVFENPAFSQGTQAIARIIAERTDEGALTVVGGGDSVAAVEKLDLLEDFSHVSTGGGASLEFLEGKTLPGIAALQG